MAEEAMWRRTGNRGFTVLMSSTSAAIGLAQGWIDSGGGTWYVET